MIKEMPAPKALFPEAKTMLLGWGSTSDSIKESVEKGPLIFHNYDPKKVTAILQDS